MAVKLTKQLIENNEKNASPKAILWRKKNARKPNKVSLFDHYRFIILKFYSVVFILIIHIAQFALAVKGPRITIANYFSTNLWIETKEIF